MEIRAAAWPLKGLAAGDAGSGLGAAVIAATTAAAAAIAHLLLQRGKLGLLVGSQDCVDGGIGRVSARMPWMVVISV